MTTVIEPKTFEGYLEQTKDLVAHSKQEKLLALIDTFMQENKESAELEAFFKGEHAFYSKNYDRALVHYMQARSIEGFEFYCYRATAFISFARADLDKAASFIEKALQQRPDDLPTIQLQHELLVKQEKFDQASSVKARIDAMTPAVEENPEPVQQQEETRMQPVKEPPSDFISSNLGVDLDSEQELKNRIQQHQQDSQAKIHAYMEKGHAVRTTRDHALWVLNGWREQKSDVVIPHLPARTGGYFIRWNGKGIVINPGSSFLERFHAEDLHTQMIDAVIVTEDNPESYADIKKIYELNYQLNKINPELHLIHYYLNHKAHQHLSHKLKPNFKQERNTVHSLELFLDSPDIEKEQISDEISLSYFSTKSRGRFADSEKTDALAMWFEFSWGMERTRLGFMNGAAWSPTLCSHFGNIDIMLSGFETTNSNDFGKLNYNESSLGYFGTYSLLEEVMPKLHLITAFDGEKGDFRMEVIRKLRKEFSKSHPNQSVPPVIIPTDCGMVVDIKTGQIKSSINDEMLDPQSMQVGKTGENFGKLQYLSKNSIL